VKRIVLIAFLALSCSIYQGLAAAQKAMTPEEETLSNLEKSLPSDPKARFFKLSEVATAAYDAGDYDKAETYANELLSEASQNQTNWNYGNAVFQGNMILGLVALKRDNNVSQAESYLFAAGRTPGSPQLISFGPNMSLAKDLLAAGEQDAVVDFLDECGNFWKADGGKLSDWKNTIRNGGTPNFGPNLNYH
jgi:tetratricopeptide (TPR) repeat protein